MSADDEPSQTPSPNAAAQTWFPSLSKAAALIASIIATGQAATTWISGHWEKEVEIEKTQREFQREDKKTDSALAESYLTHLVDSHVSESDKLLLVSALSQLDGHPLQHFAKSWLQQYEANKKQQIDAFENKIEAKDRKAELEAEIKEYRIKLEMSWPNAGETKDIQDKIAADVTELRTLSGASALAVKGVGAETGIATKAPPMRNDLERLSAKLLEPILTGKEFANAQKNVPLLKSAMSEFGLTDRKWISLVIAIVKVQSIDFAPSSEFLSGSQWEGRADLGNVNPGDGARFKGRGFLQLTGRAAYASMSQRLGHDFVNAPDDLNDPNFAARALCAWLADRKEKIGPALESGDMVRVLTLINGGPNGLNLYGDAYRKVLALFDSA